MTTRHMVTSSPDNVIRREGFVVVDGHQIPITDFGGGDRVVLLAPSALVSRRMQEPWARELAAKGFRVVCANNVGRALSSRPINVDRYSSEGLGRQLIGVLDALGVETAVVGGTGIGANAALEAAVLEPSRIVGVLAEMPILDRSAARLMPLLTAAYVYFTVGRPLAWVVSGFAGALPGKGLTATMVRDILGGDPAAKAQFINGLHVGRLVPPTMVRNSVAAPALVVMVRNGIAHSGFDAITLLHDLPDAQLQVVRSLWTLRRKPRAVTPAIVSFLHEAWAAPWVIARSRKLRSVGDTSLN